MKKTLLLILLLFCAFIIKAQTIHSFPNIPTSTTSDVLDIELRYNNVGADGPFFFIDDNDVVDHIEILMSPEGRLTNIENNNFYGGTPSTYYARRVQAHILFYYYFQHVLDETRRLEHLGLFKHYFDLLIREQCYAGSSITNPCSQSHGGFSSETQSNDNMNPLTTAIALEAYLDARKFIKVVCDNDPSNSDPLMPITEVELENRILQAKNELLAYPEYNNQYFNMTAAVFLALSKHIEAYNDQASKDFLFAKGNELLNSDPPLRSNTNPGNTPVWTYAENWTPTYSWNEGLQADGSWKDFGRDVSQAEINDTSNSINGPRTYNDFERWHDSESDYHGIMIEGMAQLFKYTDNQTLRDEAKNAVYDGINHLIDYNGEANGLEITNANFYNKFIDIGTLDTNNSNYYYGELETTRLTTNFRIAKYHRETSDFVVYDSNGDPILVFLEDPDDPDTNIPGIQTTIIGAQLLRSLIVSRNNLKPVLTSNDNDILDKLIDGLAYGIIQDTQSLAAEQFYDLAVYLNRNAVNGNFSGTQYTKDKLIVSFENELISAFHEGYDAGNDDVVLVDNFYINNQESFHMTSGDFDKNGDKDEAIISFEYGLVYRYKENADGRLAPTESVYSGGALTLALESGDFNNNLGDELILALDNGEIQRYEENTSDDLILLETFYTNASRTVNKMVALDFDNDGEDELIIAFNDGTIDKYEVDTSGNLVLSSHGMIYDTAQTVTDMTSGDYDNNGTEELIVAFDSKDIQRYFENHLTVPVTNFNQPILNLDTSIALNVTTGDFDNNNEDELIAIFDNKKIRRYRIDGTNNLTTTSNDIVYNGSQLAKKMVVGDFNNDTIDELIVSFNTLIYRCKENASGDLLLTELIYNCGNANNTMTVLQKSGTASRAASNDIGFIETTTRSDIKVYPNPVNALLNVRGLTEDTPFSIYSIEGKLILNGIVNKEGHINTSQFAKGFYILKVKEQTFKILKN